ncbi:hypothetical protein SKAU_G00178430 [Synaphobranchus kaupii]|uniref:HD/PDEase domain-containing protein n=1 Tax=Synaphobranchus kaupii TaxID=118154 RepID=A0A9Q1FM57_SYNKA|nr:hypothetical protein SKAU_G00178430 [Synaphobranchus kaupii]
MAANTQINKIFNDPIHGSIELHPHLVSIIDTPEFQRLRYIKQMGSVYFVYPGACHNRFEHSIGVAYLAGELVQALNKQYHVHQDANLKKLLSDLKKEKSKQSLLSSEVPGPSQEPRSTPAADSKESNPQEEEEEEEEEEDSQDDEEELITEEERLCVQIAALCHDLGHGPFSHLTDTLFIPRVLEEKEKEGTEQEDKRKKLENWTHEKQSQAMLDEMIKNLEAKTRKKKEDKEAIKFIKEHLDFIKELIDPPDHHFKEGTDPPKKPTHYKSFLYEIVSNKRNGIDVDKMDYFARDCYHLGIASNFNFRRFCKFARVCLCDEEMQICMRDKEVGNMYGLHDTRNNIQEKACQHRVSSIIDTMIVDAFIKADGVLKISDSLLDVTKHTKLTDGIYQKILHLDVKEELDARDKENLIEAQKILQRIERRELYKCVCEIYLQKPIAQKQKKALEKELGEHIETKILERTYGMKGVNPIEQINFYTKSKPNEAGKLKRRNVSQLLPNVFHENVLHVYCKKPMLEEEEIGSLAKKAKQWCKKKGYKE